MIFVGSTIVFIYELKYGLNIDPVEEERKRLVEQKRIQHSETHKPKITHRFIHVDAHKLETILEERDV
jgi:hypothetical protein